MPEISMNQYSGIYHSIKRVLEQSGCSRYQFYQGLFFRTLERCFEILPFCICYAWLYLVITENSNVYIMDATSNNVLFFSSALLAIFICQLIFSYLGQRQSFLGSYNIIAQYRQKMIDQVRQLPLGTLYQYRAGQLADIMTDDIKRIESIFTHLAADLFSAMATPILLLLALIFIDWQLTLSLVICLPIGLFLLNKGKNFFIRAGQNKQDMFRDTAGLLVEFVMGIKTLRLFNKTDSWLASLTQRFHHIKVASLHVEAWGAGPVVLYRFMVEAGLVIFLLVAAVWIDIEANGIVYILYLLLAYKLFGPLLEVAEHFTILRFATQSESKIQTLLETELLVEPTHPVIPKQYDIDFNHVSFSYDNELVLNDVSFSVPQHSITAIVGSSGSGKSSIMNLLARFYDPQQGEVNIGGVDIKNIGTHQLYQSVSMVFQQVQLYDSSIIENVRTGRPDASDDDVIATCKAANCDRFIQKLPQNYHTQVGEGGARLSGGERQRLSIARALLKNAPILLLDEATASVDPEAQYEIQQALNHLAIGRTVIMIAHRLSTVVNADQIIVVDNGCIVEKGNHYELLRTNGLYKKLWDSQGINPLKD